VDRRLLGVCLGVAAGLGCAAGGAAPGSADDSNPGGNPGSDAGASMTPGDAGGTTPDAGSPGGPITPTMPPVPVPVPGVVVDGKCFPLCADASTDPDGDGYGYEKGASCVVPGSAVAAIRLSCQVGGPLPPPGHPAGSPGVLVDGNCIALCTVLKVDDNGDGYGFEFDESCIFPGSTVAMTSFSCSTGSSTTTGTTAGDPGRLRGEVCVRLCTSANPDPDGDGYGFEFGASCLAPGSAAAALGIDCKVGVPEPTAPPITLNPNPPRGQVTKPAGIASRGFFVNGGRLYDKFGNDFVMRGLNNPHIWFDVGDQYYAYNALDNIAADGANTIRVVWQTTGTAPLLRRILRHVVELRMIPMVELHDVTGNGSNASLLTMAAYYAQADVKQVLLDYEEFLVVNIANEWSGTDFRGGYQAAVAQLRASGINHTLVVDANGFGQNAAAIFTDGAALLDADPQHNLLFSVHMYDAYAAPAGGRTKITQTLEQAGTLHLPLVIGEFGWQAGSPPVAIDAAFIMSECARLRLGYLAWSWKGNDTSLSYLDMSADWEGQQLTSWGTQVIRGANGISGTAAKASIFTL